MSSSVVHPRLDSSAPLALHLHVREYAHALTALCPPGARLLVHEYMDGWQFWASGPPLTCLASLDEEFLAKWLTVD
ncbi:MAG: hypothetical protein KF681_08540 [Bdellovibrionaceae bacterium]|nr:hypothetical protein [Pseudobdellovibrionaceae bacterium]